MNTEIERPFQIGFSADFLDENGSLVFPDIGLSLLDGVPGLSYNFLKDYRSSMSRTNFAISML